MCLTEITNCDETNKTKELSDKLRSLLKTKEKFLDKVDNYDNYLSTIYQLLQNSGRLSEFLFFAEVKVHNN